MSGWPNSTRTNYRQYCIGCIENVQYGSETAWFGIKTYSMEITINSMGVRLGIEYLKIFPALLWLYNQDWVSSNSHTWKADELGIKIL